MRVLVLIVACVLAACTGGGLPFGKDDLASSVDLKGVDLKGADLHAPDLKPVAGDLAEQPPAQCISTCDRCSGGGCCGTACCAEGEWCDSTQHCRCGTNAACGAMQVCATGGPSKVGQCGGICCGDPQHPCPL